MAESRAQAQALILAGRVLVAGAAVTKAGAQVPEDAQVTLKPPPQRYVSRGGERLAAALAWGSQVAILKDIQGSRCSNVPIFG